MFGLTSLAVLAPGGVSTLGALSRRDWRLVPLLGFTGNVGYRLAMLLAVPRAGSAVVALVIGCLPVVMAVLGNNGPRQLPLRYLATPLGLIASGLLAANGAGFANARTVGALVPLFLGLLPTIAALTLWTWYGLRNASALAERPTMSPITRTALTGVGTLLALPPVLIVGLVAGWSAVPSLGLVGPSALRFLGWSLILGLMSSWAATWAPTKSW